jgi:hypothetical protein
VHAGVFFRVLSNFTFRCAHDATPFYALKLPLTSPTSGGRSVGIVHSQTEAMELFIISY